MLLMLPDELPKPLEAPFGKGPKGPATWAKSPPGN